MERHRSALGRVLYFTMPEQEIIYRAVDEYVQRNPGVASTSEDILKDFYRRHFDGGK